MVGAMVVCSSAAPDGVAAACLMISGSNSQRLAIAMRIMNEPCGARVSIIMPPGPSSFIGAWSSAILVTARARVSTPPESAGGADEWPPSASAVTIRVA